jgi:multiple sugar transport system ATP-binding protein
VVVTGSQRIALGEETLSARPALGDWVGKPIVLGVRPEDLEDVGLVSDAPEDRRLKGRVELREALGSEIMVHFAVDAPPAVTEDVRELAEDVGDERIAQVDGDRPQKTTIVGRFGARSEVQLEDSVEVAVDTRALHFFDPETGLGIYDDNKPEKGAA